MSSPISVRCLLMKTQALSPEMLALVARRFAVLAEPLRLRLLQSLVDGEKDVRTLVALTGGTQANVSRHLQTLAGAHLLRRRKAGLHVFYAIADPTIFRLCELVCGRLEKEHRAAAGVFGGA
jgi:DNA-binding transcriptional ArsR family regulator